MNKSTKFKKCNLYNFPQRLNKADYQNCCKLVVECARNNPTVASLYLMGGEWLPGISDLDIVVVYKSNTKPQPLKGPWGLSNRADFIFTHSYLSFDEKDFAGFYYLYPKETSNLKLIWGKDIIISNPHDELSELDNKLLFSFILFSVLVNKLLLFPRYYQERELSVRRIIGELYSLIYTFYILEKITDEKIGKDFSFRIKNLRNKWFADDLNKNINELFSLLGIGIDLILRTTIILDESLGALSLPQNKNIVFENKKYFISFIEDWRGQAFLDEFKGGSIDVNLPVVRKRIENYKLVLPSSFSYFFTTYASMAGDFSYNIKNSLSGTFSDTSIFSKGAILHTKAMNSIFHSSRSVDGLYKVPFSYGFPLFKGRVIRQKAAAAIVRLIRALS